MKILFLHRNFPAQFRHLASILGKDPNNQVFFGSTRREGSIPGVTKVLYEKSRAPRPQTHHYVRGLEEAVLEGQAASFVLSWSMLEALATGCLVVGSATPPVKEVIEDGVNGLLVDFFEPEQIAERVIEALENPQKMAAIRTRARETIVEGYNLHKLLHQHLDWIMQ